MISRQDLDMIGGEKATFEWTLYKPDGSPYDLTGDTVALYVSKGSDRAYHLKKESTPGIHYNAVGGTIRLTLNQTAGADIPFARDARTWWYEIWRTPAGTTDNKPHIVGELRISSSVRV